MKRIQDVCEWCAETTYGLFGEFRATALCCAGVAIMLGCMGGIPSVVAVALVVCLTLDAWDFRRAVGQAWDAIEERDVAVREVFGEMTRKAEREDEEYEELLAKSDGCWAEDEDEDEDEKGFNEFGEWAA
jgi:flagellar biosynthesis component FlhA